MKYVITMIDGEYQKPVRMEEFLVANEDANGFASDATTAWALGKPFIVGGGASPQFTSFLIDLPA